jgi:hypothetical protein
MNWYELYNRNVICYDLILRDPFNYGSLNFLSLNKINRNLSSIMEVSFSKVKNKDFFSLLVYSVLQELSFGNKVLFQKIKGLGGKKSFRLSTTLKGYFLFFFLDFFLNFIIRGLKRRYIILKHSQSISGLLNFRFSSLAELEIDDYFFFSLDNWFVFLNNFLKYSDNSFLNNVYSNFFKKVFNFQKLLKYEVFGGKR